MVVIVGATPFVGLGLECNLSPLGRSRSECKGGGVRRVLLRTSRDSIRHKATRWRNRLSRIILFRWECGFFTCFFEDLTA